MVLDQPLVKGVECKSWEGREENTVGFILTSIPLQLCPRGALGGDGLDTTLFLRKIEKCSWHSSQIWLWESSSSSFNPIQLLNKLLWKRSPPDCQMQASVRMWGCFSSPTSGGCDLSKVKADGEGGSVPRRRCGRAPEKVRMSYLLQWTRGLMSWVKVSWLNLSEQDLQSGMWVSEMRVCLDKRDTPSPKLFDPES